MVIGEDTRTPVANLALRPHSAICLIQALYDKWPGVVGYGTGFLVAAGRIATAAHVLWNTVDGRTSRPRLPDRIQVFLGEGLLSGHPELAWTLTPDPSANPAHPDFIAGDDTADVARLSLPTNPAAPLAVRGFPADLRPGDALAVGGFPIDRGPFGHYEGSGPLATDGPILFHHQVDTGHGQSGAPVRVLRNGGWAAVGIHLGDDTPGADGAPRNRARALTPDIVTWLTT